MPKKTAAQLDREIAEALGQHTRPISARKGVRHFSESKDKRGGTHYYVTYEDRSGHPISGDELRRYRQGEQRRASKAPRSQSHHARKATMDASAGFAVHTDHEDVIKDNAREHFGPDYGDAADRARVMKAGLVDASGKITDRGWEVLNKDFRTLENNALAWLRKVFGRASDQGHDSSGDLIGNLSFDPRSAPQAHNIVVGKNERIDFNDASYGDFARSGAWKGVSGFGQDVLGGHITFFDIQPPDAFEVAENTADKAAARRRAARRR